MAYEDLGPFGIPEIVPRWGFPKGPLLVGYVWECDCPLAPPMEAQMETVKGCHKVFHEKITLIPNKPSPRELLWEVLNFLQPEDTLIVHDIGCLGNSAREVIAFVRLLFEPHGCYLYIPGSIDITDPNSVAFTIELLGGLQIADWHKEKIVQYKAEKRKASLEAECAANVYGVQSKRSKN